MFPPTWQPEIIQVNLTGIKHSSLFQNISFNSRFAQEKTKVQISCAVTSGAITAQLISAFVFATCIVKFLF